MLVSELEKHLPCSRRVGGEENLRSLPGHLPIVSVVLPLLWTEVSMTQPKPFARLRELLSGATPGDWKLDHDDTFVMVEKTSPQTADWYWITGDMSVPEDSFHYGTDESMRGPKEVVQANCRLICELRNNAEKLLQCLDEAEMALEFYAEGRHMTENDHDVIQVIPGNDEFIDHIVGKRATKALAKIRALGGVR